MSQSSDEDVPKTPVKKRKASEEPKSAAKSAAKKAPAKRAPRVPKEKKVSDAEVKLTSTINQRCSRTRRKYLETALLLINNPDLHKYLVAKEIISDLKYQPLTCQCKKLEGYAGPENKVDCCTEAENKEYGNMFQTIIDDLTATNLRLHELQTDILRKKQVDKLSNYILNLRVDSESFTDSTCVESGAVVKQFPSYHPIVKLMSEYKGDCKYNK